MGVVSYISFTYKKGLCTPKIHKIKEKSDVPPLRPIVSSINSYNYNLASYLCELITPFIPLAHCTKDSFTFIKNIQEVSTQDFVRCLQSFY